MRLWAIGVQRCRSSLTCDLLVTYGPARDGRRPRVQGARRSDAPVPARPALHPRGPDPHRARVGGGDDALRRDEAPEGPRGGRPGRHPTVGPGEVALPQRGADPRGARPVDRQVHGAPRRGARRPEARPGGTAMTTSETTGTERAT